MYWPTTRSSSTTRTFPVGPGGDGKVDAEGAAEAGGGLDFDSAPVLLHDAVTDREAKAGAPSRRLGGEERLEDLGQVGGGDAGAGVRHLGGDLAPFRRV